MSAAYRHDALKMNGSSDTTRCISSFPHSVSALFRAYVTCNWLKFGDDYRELTQRETDPQPRPSCMRACPPIGQLAKSIGSSIKSF